MVPVQGTVCQVLLLGPRSTRLPAGVSAPSAAINSTDGEYKGPTQAARALLGSNLLVCGQYVCLYVSAVNDHSGPLLNHTMCHIYASRLCAHVHAPLCNPAMRAEVGPSAISIRCTPGVTVNGSSNSPVRVVLGSCLRPLVQTPGPAGILSGAAVQTEGS